MIVIVEGADGSGKSTLCKQLQRYGYISLRRERSDKNFSASEFIKLCMSNDKYVIDRALLTPWAYRLLDKQPLNEDDFSLQTALYLLQHSIVIYCNCPNAFANSIIRGEENITIESLHNKLCNNYKFIIDTLKLYNISTIFEYDFEKHSVEDVINFIKEVKKNGVR